MIDYKNIDTSEFINTDFDCECKKHHSFHLDHFFTGYNILEKSVLEIVKKYNNIFIFFDENTKKAAGNKVVEIINSSIPKKKLKTFCFPKSDFLKTNLPTLSTDEKSIGTVLTHMDLNTDLIIAVGSGTINDIGKFAASRAKVPYAVVCTAPSMDGYLSFNAALTINNSEKISGPATVPSSVIADFSIMDKAPLILKKAGFGDLLGKITAILDWKLANHFTGEYFCPVAAHMSDRAVKLLSNKKIIEKSEDIFNALILTGIAMAYVNVSRPASGSEHLMSHYWEIEHLKHNELSHLHGIKVGVATCTTVRMYHLIKDTIPAEIMSSVPDYDEAENLLKSVDAPYLPSQIGIDKKLYLSAVLNANKIRDRYGILQHAKNNNLLQKNADYLANKYYKK